MQFTSWKPNLGPKSCKCLQAGRLASRPYKEASSRTETCLNWLSPLSGLNQFDLITVGIFDKRDFGPAEFHRAWLAHDLDALLFKFRTSLVNVIGTDGQMTEGIAHLVARLTPVVSQLDYAAVALIAIADKREREFTIGIVMLAHELHAQR